MSSNTSQQSAPTPELSRDLNLFHITMMGLGMMIGAGVFVGMGISIDEAGPGGVVLTFALNGALAMLTAMSFAELSSAIPRAGGAYNFARIGFGRGTSFLAGWMEWFASSVAGSMYAITVSTYTLLYFKNLGWMNWLFSIFSNATEDTVFGITVKIVAVLTAGLFIMINFRGSSETGKIGAIITVGQIIFVITIGIFGLYAIAKDPSRLENFKNFMPNGWGKLFLTMGFTYVAFEGYEVIAQAGDEAIEPRKNLPKAMIYSVIIVTFIYVLVAIATVVSVKAGTPGVEGEPWKWIGEGRETGFFKAIPHLLPYGEFILTLAVIFSATSALNATIYSGTRASYALGRDKMMPAFFAKIHPKNKTPYGALIATSCIVLIAAVFLPIDDVVSSASIMFIFLFFLVNLCVIKIRRSMADELTYGFMLPLFPIPPILAIICQCILAVELRELSKIAWIIAPLWVFVGAAAYWFYARKRASFAEHEIQVLEEEVLHKEEKYPVMVAVANPSNAAQMVQSTYRICGAKDAQVELIHMVPVPEQVALDDAGEYMIPGKEGLREAMLYLSLHFPINTTIRYCRNIARGIISAIREKKTKMLVLGWHGRPSKNIFNIGATIDPIIDLSPCDVVVLKDCAGNKEFRDILVPVAGGPNAGLAMEIANIMAEDDSAKITVLTIDTGRDFDLTEFIENQSQKLEIPTERFTSKSIKAKSPTLAILREANNYDLVVLGTTNRSMVRQFASRSIPEKIACRCGKPTIIVKKAGQGVTSLLSRWF